MSEPQQTQCYGVIKDITVSSVVVRGPAGIGSGVGITMIVVKQDGTEERLPKDGLIVLEQAMIPKTVGLVNHMALSAAATEEHGECPET